ncbi:MAG: MFS transporter [Dokdonella sp.]
MSAPSGVTTAPVPRWRQVLATFTAPSALTLFFLGFGCGLPFLLVGYTLSIWLRDVGLELGAIGLISYISLFYTLKFVWAPLVDWIKLPGFGRLGRRRGWLLAAQIAVCLSLAAMGWTGPLPALTPFLALMAMMTFSGATQDIVVDAYRIEIAPDEAQGALAATYSFGYRLGLICGGAGALYLADVSGWRTAYLVMAALMLLPMIALLMSPEPVPRAIIAAPRSLRAAVDAFSGPFVEFFSRNGWLLAVMLLAFVGLFKLPDQILGVVLGPFYRDVGFSKTEIATVSKLYGVWIGLAGAFFGGIAVAAFGSRRLLLPAAVVVSLSNLLFILMSVYPGEMWTFVLAISGDNFAQGFSGTVLIAYMSALASKHYTATQYALLSSLANLPGKLLGGVSGFMVQAWTFTGFFIFTTLSIIPTLWLLYWLSRREQREPAA